VADVFPSLPLFSWRDQQYPISERQVSFNHNGVEQRVEYRDNEFIEQLGAGSLMFRYTIPMRENIARGPYKNLFTVGYPILFAACRNKEPGVLVDPILGERICVAESWVDETDMQRRDGVDVRVEFKHSQDIEEVEDLQTITVQGLKSEAGALDADIKKVDWKQEPSPGPLADILDAVTGAGAQVEAQGGRATAALHDYAHKLEKAEAQIERLENPNVAPLRQAMRRNRNAALKLGRRAKDPNKQIVTVVNNYNRSITAVAAEADMTVAELLKQNPILARLPFVPAGTAINIVKRSGRAA